MAAQSKTTTPKKAFNNRAIASTDAAPGATPNDTVEVLYQKMGDRWFAFSLVDDEIFVGSITQQELEARGALPAGKA